MERRIQGVNVFVLVPVIVFSMQALERDKVSIQREGQKGDRGSLEVEVLDLFFARVMAQIVYQ